MPDRPLYWELGRPDALQSVNLSGTVEDAEPSSEYELVLDHSAETIEMNGMAVPAVFALAEPPRLSAVDNVVFLLCCDETDGGQAKVLVKTNAEFAAGYGSADITVTGTRRGVLNAPE
jgi:hypothetical protein